MSDFKLAGVHHVAYRCNDAKETVEWYVKHLSMKFVLAIAEDQVPDERGGDAGGVGQRVPWQPTGGVQVVQLGPERGGQHPIVPAGQGGHQSLLRVVVVYLP